MFLHRCIYRKIEGGTLSFVEDTEADSMNIPFQDFEDGLHFGVRVRFIKNLIMVIGGDLYPE